MKTLALVAALWAMCIAGSVAGAQDTSKVTRRTEGGKTKDTLVARLLPLAALTARGTSDSLVRLQSMRDAIGRVERMQRDSAIRANAAESRAMSLAIQAHLDARMRLERDRVDSVARVDALAREELARARAGTGFYFGIGAGASRPADNLKNGYAMGWNVTVPVGWDFADRPFGVRLDFAVDQLTGRNASGLNVANAAVWSLNGDVKLRKRLATQGRVSTVYVLAGAGAHRIVSGGGVGGATGTLAGAKSANGFATSFGDATTRIGLNGGAGVSLAWGRSMFFAEARYVSVQSGNSTARTARFIPVIVGLAF